MFANMNYYYRDFGSWIRTKFPFRVQKISVNAGFSCPNRDGTISHGGCSYCDNRTFTPSYCLDNMTLEEQIAAGEKFFSKKYSDMKYLVYFQSFSGTYHDLPALRDIYSRALSVENIVGIVIGTRPDYLDDNLLDYLAELNKQTFLIVEIGIESANDETLKRINRGHTFECTCKTINKLHKRGIVTCGHVILGLPGEDASESLRQAHMISSLPLDILKLHQLQIIKGTRLASEYQKNPFHLYSVEEYIDLVIKYISVMRKDILYERFVSQSPAGMLLAPKWGLKNYEFTNKLNAEIERRMKLGVLKLDIVNE